MTIPKVRISDLPPADPIAGGELLEVVQDGANRQTTAATVGLVRRVTVSGLQPEDFDTAGPAGVEIVPGTVGAVTVPVQFVAYLAPDEMNTSGDATGNLSLRASGTSYEFRNKVLDLRYTDAVGAITMGVFDGMVVANSDDNSPLLDALPDAGLSLVPEPDYFTRPISSDPADITIVEGGTGYLEGGSGEEYYMFRRSDGDGVSQLYCYCEVTDGEITAILSIGGDRRIVPAHLNKEFTNDDWLTSAVIVPTELATYTPPSWGTAGLTVTCDYIVTPLGA